MNNAAVPYRIEARASALHSLVLATLLTGLGGIAIPHAAFALPCLQDRFGSSVNCTANDIRITDFHDIVVTDDGCVSLGDTVTFDAVLTVVTTATSRYDVGLFIGTDGEQALTGQCKVRALPTGPAPFRSLDGDSCGDTTSSVIVNVPVRNVTVSCADANGNHMLDVASCTSWQQNSNDFCSGAPDVVPGTASKCNCPLTPLDIDIFVPEPICETNAECASHAPGCNDGVCNPGSPNADEFGCVITPNNANCNDGAFCNGIETCSPSGSCTPGTHVNCNDGVSCTLDACNEQTDSCTHAPSNAACSDGAFCNGNETCNAILCCQAGTPVNCNDGVSCTTDSCSESTDSCAHTPSNAACSDGAFCNGNETCSATLGCRPGTPVNCADSVSCTTDACNEQTDSCTHVPSNAACSDNVFCNGAEICDATTGCHAGTPVQCADTIDCTLDSCDETLNACLRIADSSLCADTNVCTTDTCSPTNGCVHTSNTVACDDGNPCTAIDVCTAGICTGSGTVCGDGVVQTVCGEGCDAGNGEICNNGIDDDGDGLIDCADPDCLESTIPNCDAACQPAPECSPIRSDPAVIYLNETRTTRSAGQRGTFVFHGRIAPSTDVSPLSEGFVIALSNANGLIYRASVDASDLQTIRERKYFFHAADPDSVIADGGIASLSIRRRKSSRGTAFTVRMTAYGDFSRATLPRMTTQVYFGDDVGFLTADWNQRTDRWTLSPHSFRDD